MGAKASRLEHRCARCGKLRKCLKIFVVYMKKPYHKRKTWNRFVWVCRRCLNEAVSFGDTARL